MKLILVQFQNISSRMERNQTNSSNVIAVCVRETPLLPSRVSIDMGTETGVYRQQSHTVEEKPSENILKRRQIR